MFELTRRGRRPSWMTPFGLEGQGDAWFDRFPTEWPTPFFGGDRTTPAFDFYEKDGKYHVSAELPGLDKDDVSVSLEDGVLTVTGNKESNQEEEGAHYYMRETRRGSFSRRIRLPEDVEYDKIDASFKDGVLHLEMPHTGESKVKKIDIH